MQMPSDTAQLQIDTLEFWKVNATLETLNHMTISRRHDICLHSARPAGYVKTQSSFHNSEVALCGHVGQYKI